MSKIERRTDARPASGAVERAYRQIKTDVLAGNHPIGARLKEEDLAEQTGVSRTPVREALRRLNAEGLVDFTPHQGAYVATWSSQDIEEIFGLRAVLESYGVRLAATRISDRQIDELEALADAVEAAAAEEGAPDLDRIPQLNDRFHKIILGAAGNKRLVRLLSGIVEMPIVLRTFSIYTPEQLRRSFNHHRELIAALRVRDPDWVAAVMEAHVRAAQAAYFLAESALPPRSASQTPPLDS